MIELLDGIILAKNAPKEAVSFSLEKGTLNYIPYSEQYKFNFLMLKNQSLDKGVFKINDIQIYPDENSETSLFFLSVNSLIRIHLCFLCPNSEKKARVKEVQDQLILLRDLPVETDEDKTNKIIAIINRVDELSPAYALFDLNDSVNNYAGFVESELAKHAANINIIILEKKTESVDSAIEVDRGDISLSIGDEPVLGKETKPKKQKIFKEPNGPFLKEFVHIFKEDKSAFAALIVPSISVLVFSMLSPLYAQTNKILLVPFIIAIIIGFVLYMIMVYRFAEFENRNQMISFTLCNLGSVLIGYGASLGIYFLFLNFDQDIKALQSKNAVGIIVSIILALLLVTSPIYVPFISRLIKKLFKKK